MFDYCRVLRRHISGIWDWGPAQQARLVVNQIDNGGLSLTLAGQKFGVSAKKAGRLYRVFKALEQMKSDEEFKGKADNKYFTLFEQAISNTKVKEWLGWDSNEYCFKNTESLHLFYSFIIEDEDAPEDKVNKRKIHDPKQIKKLGAIIAKNHDLLDEINDWNLTIDQAYEKAINEHGYDKIDWKQTINDARSKINQIPIEVITENSQDYKEMLINFKSLIDQHIQMVDAKNNFGGE